MFGDARRDADTIVKPTTCDAFHRSVIDSQSCSFLNALIILIRLRNDYRGFYLMAS